MIKTSLIAFVLFLSSVAIAAEAPRITLVHGKKKLQLPEKYRAFIAKKYPGYRIPNEKDIEYLWAKVDSSDQALPYVTWGDYDGNGMTDIALFLISKDNKKWEFSISLQNVKGYSFEFGTNNTVAKYRPQAVELQTLKKGKPLTIETYDFSAKRMNTFTHRFSKDAVLYSIDAEDPVEVYYWEGSELIYGEYGAD